MKSSQRKICSAVALIFSAMSASAAMAATPHLISGGSSLVGPSIISEGTVFPSTDGTFSYFTANSSTGQAAFLTNNASLYNTTGVTVTGTVDFGNSDAALTGPQVTAYNAVGGLGVTDGPLIQIPYVTTPITIPLTNAPTGTGPTLTSKAGDTTPTVALNDNDLCGIFSGRIVNWAGTPAVSGGAAATPGVVNPDSATGATYTLNKAITVVYRVDGSGTTDLLTRHLAAVCHTAADVVAHPTLTNNSNIEFTETLTFASLFPSNTPPANFIGESGSGAIALELTTLRTAGTAAVAYLSPDFTNTLLAPSSASAATNNLSVASLFNSTSLVDVPPTAANANAALIPFAPPGTPSNPASPADPTQWVPNAANPPSGYPISGTTNILVSTCYANPTATVPSPAVAVIDFLTAHYSSAANAAIIAGNGFATVPSSYAAAITANFLTNTSTNNLTIQHTPFCTTHAGR